MKFSNGIALIAFIDPDAKIEALRWALALIQRARVVSERESEKLNLRMAERHLVEIMDALLEDTRPAD